MKQRTEQDSLGKVLVPGDCYWGAQTARSLQYFRIGHETMPKEIIRALGIVKKVCAQVNNRLGTLDTHRARLIQRAAQEVIDGKLHAHFPLHIWQTGSGTQTNMNANEVIANRAIELNGGKLGSKAIHPNDHVNMSQSSNDVFPTAMHIATAEEVVHCLQPALRALHDALQKKAREFKKIIKVGRTHLMDAVPISLGQEFSGYVEQLRQDRERIVRCMPEIYALAIGGTAVGTGLNAHPQFGTMVAQLIAKETRLPFIVAKNRCAAISAHDPLVFLSGALKTVACSLMKIANDIRWMGSGPRCGLNELFLPANELGSSIMPGKINPTQCEAMTMVCIQVIANDAAITMADSQGNFELNTFKPLIIYCLLNSITLLSHVCNSFTRHLVIGLKPNTEQIRDNIEKSLMLATALTPKIGYDAAAKVVKKAYEEGISLKEAAMRLDCLSEKEFNVCMGTVMQSGQHAYQKV